MNILRIMKALSLVSTKGALSKHLHTMKTRRIDAIFDKLYYNLDNPSEYSSKKNIFEAAKKIDKSVKRSEVDAWFRKQLATTLHKPVKYRFPRNKTIVMSIDDQYQADLCDMSRFLKYNDDMKFLLKCIDCFSKFAWVLPIKNKTSQEIVRVLKIIFSKKVCKRLQTDKGTEFLNANVRTLLKKMVLNYGYLKMRMLRLV